MKLNASSNSGAIWCISNFQQPCISKMAGVLERKIHLNLYVIQFFLCVCLPAMFPHCYTDV